MKDDNRLREASIPSLFFQYYVPALISILSITLHQVINGIILGQQVGKDGLAVVGLYGPVVIIFVALILPLVIGGGILIGKSLGAGFYSQVQAVFEFVTTVVLAFAGILFFLAPWVTRPLAVFLAGSEDPAMILIQSLSDYIFWQLLGSPCFFLGMVWGNFIRTDNAPKVSKNASLIAVTLNLVLDLLLIVGLKWGIKGASIATVLSLLVSQGYLFWYIFQGKTNYSFKKFRFRLRLKGWKELVNLGLPSFVSELSFSVGLLLINQRIVPYGSLAITAFGLVNYISFIFLRPLTAAMIAALPIFSFNIGAQLPHRVLATFRFVLLFTLVFGAVVTAIGFLVPDLLVRIFAGDDTVAFRSVASRAISLYFLLFLFAGPNYILGAYLQSIGKSALASVINITKGCGLVFLFVAVLPTYFHLELDGIWLARFLAEMLAFVGVGAYTLYKKKDYYTERAVLAKK